MSVLSCLCVLLLDKCVRSYRKMVILTSGLSANPFFFGFSILCTVYGSISYGQEDPRDPILNLCMSANTTRSCLTRIEAWIPTINAICSSTRQSLFLEYINRILWALPYHKGYCPRVFSNGRRKHLRAYSQATICPDAMLSCSVRRIHLPQSSNCCCAPQTSWTSC